MLIPSVLISSNSLAHSASSPHIHPTNQPSDSISTFTHASFVHPSFKPFIDQMMLHHISHFTNQHHNPPFTQHPHPTTINTIYHHVHDIPPTIQNKTNHTIHYLHMIHHLHMIHRLHMIRKLPTSHTHSTYQPIYSIPSQLHHAPPPNKLVHCG